MLKNFFDFLNKKIFLNKNLKIKFNFIFLNSFIHRDLKIKIILGKFSKFRGL